MSQSRPHSAAPAAPVVDNRNDRERDWESEEPHREKRSSEEMGPLDHRGDHGESGEKKPVQRGRDVNTNSNSNSSSSKPGHIRSPCLSGVIYPLISEVRH